MAVEQPHADERCRVGGVCLYVSRLTIPEYGHAVRGKVISLPSARVARLVPRKSNPNSPASAGVTVRNPVKPVSITASMSRVCPAEPLQSKGHYRLVGGVHHALESLGAPQGAAAEVMQCAMPDPEQPDVNSARSLRTETVRRGNHGVTDGPTAAVHINGDDRSVMVGFDVLPNVAFVDLIPEAGGLLGCAAGHHLGLLRYGGSPLEDSADRNPIQPQTPAAGCSHSAAGPTATRTQALSHRRTNIGMGVEQSQTRIHCHFGGRSS